MRIAIAGGTGTAGRYAVEAARAQGHDVVVLARSRGVDVYTGVGLPSALAGADAVIDATNATTSGDVSARKFFTTVSHRLQAEGAAAGVSRLVVLSIVGIDRVPGFEYYEAKVAHEQAALPGPVPVTVVRTTQFHEFPVQFGARSREGDELTIPHMLVQTVAARTVGEVLVEAAVTPPADAVVELAGPGAPVALIELVRALAARRNDPLHLVQVEQDTMAGRALAGGALLPGPGARLAGPTFEEWLAGPDAA